MDEVFATAEELQKMIINQIHITLNNVEQVTNYLTKCPCDEDANSDFDISVDRLKALHSAYEELTKVNDHLNEAGYP